MHKALLAHPLIGQVPQADELLDLLLTSGAEHLPQLVVALVDRHERGHADEELV